MSVRRTLVLALTFLLALTAACGGGGGGGGPTEPPPPPPPTRGVFFTPQASPGSGISLASVASADPTTLILEVRANSVTDLYGLAFDLRYPGNLLQLVRTTQGPFLSGGTVQSSQGPGLLIMGISRLGDVAGATGSGVLLTLEFRATAAGEGSFTFEQNTAVSSSGQPLSGLTWSTGTVRVVL
ncbi:MAG TPA: cohesin domain-containing protein [Thermoanaerobaculia bacterium]